MKKVISNIINDDWYKTATPEEMRIALMHVEQAAMDRLFSNLNEEKSRVRDAVYEECCDKCGW